MLERGNKRTLKFNNIRKGCLAQHYLSKLLNSYVWTAIIYLNCQTYLFKLPNLFVLISKCICQLYQVQGGLLGKNLSAKGVLANFPTTLFLLLLQNFIKYEVKLFWQSPMLTQELGLRALSFLSKSLQFTTFQQQKRFKQTSKKLRVSFFAFKQIINHAWPPRQDCFCTEIISSNGIWIWYFYNHKVRAILFDIC